MGEGIPTLQGGIGQWHEVHRDHRVHARALERYGARVSTAAIVLPADGDGRWGVSKRTRFGVPEAIGGGGQVCHETDCKAGLQDAGTGVGKVASGTPAGVEPGGLADPEYTGVLCVGAGTERHVETGRKIRRNRRFRTVGRPEPSTFTMYIVLVATKTLNHCA